jgi:hypothetical protein
VAAVIVQAATRQTIRRITSRFIRAPCPVAQSSCEAAIRSWIPFDYETQSHNQTWSLPRCRGCGQTEGLAGSSPRLLAYAATKDAIVNFTIALTKMAMRQSVR